MMLTPGPNHHMPNTDIVDEIAKVIGSRGLIYPVIESLRGRIGTLQTIDEIDQYYKDLSAYTQKNGPVKF